MKPKRGSKGGASQKDAEWREAARADLFTIVDYISLDNPDAALRLMEEIEDKVTKLAGRPKLYRTGGLLAHVRWSSDPITL
jgi:plasmid stabilization system protein ParE